MTIHGSTWAKVIDVEDLPPFAFPAGDSGSVMHYLKSLLALKTASGATNPCVLLPSLESLGEAFQLSAWEVRKALRELKADGYDNFIPGLYGHITIWDKKTAVAV